MKGSRWIVPNNLIFKGTGYNHCNVSPPILIISHNDYPPLSNNRPCLTTEPRSDRISRSDPRSDRDFGPPVGLGVGAP